MRLGVHISIAGSIDKAVDRALEKGCTAFQIFTRNPRGWMYKELSKKEVDDFTKKIVGSDIIPVVHMPYLPNLASSKKDLYDKSVESLKTELDRCGRLNIPFLVTHLGSHLGEGMNIGFEKIIKACRESLHAVDNSVMLLLENTSGTKNSMGTRFEDIRFILEQLGNKGRIGVCFDTCHAFAAGYSLIDKKTVNSTLEKFEKIIGFERLKMVHLNDSKGELNSHLDRHEHIGMGYIGVKGFSELVKHPSIQELPWILETPLDSRRDNLGNINVIKKLAIDSTFASQ